MAVGNPVLENQNGAVSSTYSSGTITVSAGDLLLLWVWGSGTGAGPPPSSFGGTLSLSTGWTLAGTAVTDGSNYHTVYWAIASGTSGTVTCNQAREHYMAMLASVPTGTFNTSNPIAAYTSGTGASASVADRLSSGNMRVVFWTGTTTGLESPAAGWTELVDTELFGNMRYLAYGATNTDPSQGGGSGGGTSWIVVEIAESSSIQTGTVASTAAGTVDQSGASVAQAAQAASSAGTVSQAGANQTTAAAAESSTGTIAQDAARAIQASQAESSEASLAATATSGQADMLVSSAAGTLTQAGAAIAQAARAESASASFVQAGANITTAARAESSAATITQTGVAAFPESRAESSAASVAQDAVRNVPAARAESAAGTWSPTALSLAVGIGAASSSGTVTQSGISIQQGAMAASSAGSVSQVGSQTSKAARAESSFGQMTALAEIAPVGLYAVHGSYVGNGSSQEITLPGGQDWTPQLIILKSDSTADGMVMWWTGMTSNRSNDVTAGTMPTTAITSVLAGSFFVGASALANSNGVTYRWVALYDPSSEYLRTGTYSGNSAADRDITIGWGSFAPDQVFVKRESVDQMQWLSSNHAANASQSLVANNVANRIDQFGSNTFRVDGADEVNGTGLNYFWLALRDYTNVLDAKTWSGNSTDNRNITAGIAGTPIFALIKANGATTAAAIRFGSHSGDSSNRVNLDSGTNRIQSFSTGSLQVGTDASVNAAFTYNGFVVGERLTDGAELGYLSEVATSALAQSATQQSKAILTMSAAAALLCTAGLLQSATCASSVAGTVAQSAITVAPATASASAAPSWSPSATGTTTATLASSSAGTMAQQAEATGEELATMASAAAPSFAQQANASQSVLRADSAAPSLGQVALARFVGAMASASVSAMTFSATIVTPFVAPKLGRSGSRSLLALKRSGSRRVDM